jgi:hypothetical protein
LPNDLFDRLMFAPLDAMARENGQLFHRLHCVVALHVM